MTTIATRIPVGSRIMWVDTSSHLNGTQGEVRTDDNSSMPYFCRMDSGDSIWATESQVVQIPKIGDTVIAVEVPGNTGYNGALVTVTEVGMIGGEPVINGEAQSRQKPDDTERVNFRYWKPVGPWAVGDSVEYVGSNPQYVGKSAVIIGVLDNGARYEVKWDVPFDNGPTESRLDRDMLTKRDGATLTVSSPEGREAVLQEQIDTLTRELARANERVEELRNRAGKWERDFMRYAERVMQEAIDRDWCSEYERVVDDIRGNLEIATIPDREVEVDIEWDETYTVTVRRSATVTLQSGYGEYEIEQAARSENGNSDADRSEVIDAVRNGNYESCEYVDDSASEA